MALILVDDKGENEIVVASGANETLDETNIEAAENEIDSAGLVYCNWKYPCQVYYTVQKRPMGSEPK